MSTRNSNTARPPRETAPALGRALAAFEGAPFPVLIGEADGRTARFANEAFYRAAKLPRTAGDDCLGEHSFAECAAMACAVDPAALGQVLEHVRRDPKLHESVRLPISGRPAVDTDGGCAVSAWTIAPAQSSERFVVLALAEATVAEEQHRQAWTAAQMRAVNERLLLAALREEELTKRAEAANEAKSLFLATVSHELRTPLTAIVGYGDLLASGISGPVTEEQQRQLGRIKMAADHLVGLIDEILFLTTVETKRQAIELEWIDVGSLVDQTKTIVAPIARAKGIPLRVESPPPGLVMHTDPMKLRQILVNLLTNAIRYSDRGEVALVTAVAGDAVKFAVVDHGVGIAPEMHERIFEPFFQVDQRLTRKVGGAGLGLAISRRLAVLMGGDLSVASTVGAGSVFTATLPIDPRLRE
jgi:signal transduction histidine kinase